MKRCSACGLEKPRNLECFPPRKGARDGLRGKCRPCHAQAMKLLYRHDERTIFMNRKSRLKRDYKLDIESYDRIFEMQNGLCAICQKPETMKYFGKVGKLVVDHNHITGVVRGLLCNGCNAALGKFGDNIELLLRAVAYLQHFNTQT